MSTSQNGWKANDPSVISTRTVPGTSVRLAVRNGAAGDLLLEVAARFHQSVERIDAITDDWGFAERLIRGSSTTLSNHASGTAIDLNATRHVLGSPASASFSTAQIAVIHGILASTGGVVRWGGDYHGRTDPMHFEINDGCSESQCAAALARLRGQSIPVPPDAGGGVLQRGSKGADVAALQRVLAAWYPDLHLAADGDYGPATEAAVHRVQQGSHGALQDDGKAGPATLHFLHLA